MNIILFSHVCFECPAVIWEVNFKTFDVLIFYGHLEMTQARREQTTRHEELTKVFCICTYIPMFRAPVDTLRFKGLLDPAISTDEKKGQIYRYFCVVA